MPDKKIGKQQRVFACLGWFALGGAAAAADVTPVTETVVPDAAPTLQLKPAPRVKPLSSGSSEPHPVFVSAQQIHGRDDNETVAEGDVQLRQLTTTVDADRMIYWQREDEVEATGNVRLKRDNDYFSGPRLRLRVKDNVGFFETPAYSITRSLAVEPAFDTMLLGAAPSPTQTTTASGTAERVEFKGEDRYELDHATFTTCKPGTAGSMPDWYAEFGELTLDYRDNVGNARDGRVVFRNVPVLYSPWLSFSLNGQRKSGLLAPTHGSTNTSGLELTVPYYWNIAPNMDATISPRIMTRRGVQWNNEFRYLEPSFDGIAEVDYLPNDRLAHSNRTGYSLLHNQRLAPGLTANLNYNGVSDDAYFRDLATNVANTSQGNLLRQASLSYGTDWWNASASVQRYQTLQDPAQPVGVPYRRQPQLSLSANRPELAGGIAMNFTGEFVRFEHQEQDIGDRTTLYPQVSLPLRNAAFYLTPKAGFSLSHYALQRRQSSGDASLSREVPIFSVDSGLVLERQSLWEGRSLLQTLEPRLYYLYVPNRDQSQIPVFDSSLADFNFAQIFSENRYNGSDRVGDANQATAALTSRLIDPETGAELVRGAVGQRYYFSPQSVTLPGEVARTNRKTDILAALSGQLLGHTAFDAGWDYNEYARRTERLNFGLRYQPEVGKVINFSYRYSADLLRQVDLSGQWPVAGHWHGVGRYNYSLFGHRLIESVAGFEYDGGCWTTRFVLQRIATATGEASSAYFIQLELNDFAKIGSNPLDLLKRSISGYGRFSQEPAPGNN